MIRLMRMHSLRPIVQMGDKEWTASFPLVAELSRDLLRQFFGSGMWPKGRE